MTYSLRLHNPTALEYFATLVADDDSLNLLEAAAAIAQDEFPQLDTQALLGELDVLSERLRSRLPADASASHKLRTLVAYFYQELGFAGNVNNYYDRSNSYLHQVLATRRGIPITLAVLFMELASAVGLRAQGVCFPGHFLVKVELGNGDVLLDPFTGHSLTRERLDEFLQNFRDESALPAASQAPIEMFLRAAAPREILARILRNLIEVHRTADDLLRLLAVQARLAVLLPQPAGGTLH